MIELVDILLVLILMMLMAILILLSALVCFASNATDVNVKMIQPRNLEHHS
jgi:hypothetical protein